MHPELNPNCTTNPLADTSTFSDEFKFHEISSKDGSVFVAVDISGKMVELCEQTGHYSHAIRCGLQEAMDKIENSTYSFFPFHFIVAADTFVYVGALGKVHSSFHSKAIRLHVKLPVEFAYVNKKKMF